MTKANYIPSLVLKIKHFIFLLIWKLGRITYRLEVDSKGSWSNRKGHKLRVIIVRAVTFDPERSRINDVALRVPFTVYHNPIL